MNEQYLNGQFPKILLIDDETTNLKILNELLRTDAKVSVAKSGRQGIDKALELSPDLILLDVLMPELDGFSTLKILKSNEATQDIPVIFITGLNSAEDEGLGLSLGAQDYIHKPFSAAVVKARVATQLNIIRKNKELLNLSAQLAAASESKSRFLANMSHEIRTPLTSVIGFSDLLLNDSLDESNTLDALTTINHSGQHLLSLINDILDLSKVEANMLELENIEVNLPSLLEEIKILLVDRVKKKGLVFILVYDFPIPETIISDPTRLKQILINLVNNAIKFTNSGYVRVRVSVNSAEKLLSFAVEDSGVGISPDNISKLFQAFSQADSSIERKFGGTGLGLNISKRLAEKFAGDISVSSEEGKGSCFTATVGLIEAEACRSLATKEDINACLRAKEKSVQPRAKLSGRVLLAEDQLEVRQLVTYLLEKQGLNVCGVENGQDLLDVVAEENFDLILSDIQMPVMDGVEALEQLKVRGNTIPVIALTANAMTHDVDSYLKAGFAACLAKPIDYVAFNLLLTKYLS